jgi:predicted amidophosphoribosyltransferase
MNGIMIDDTHTDGLKVGKCPRCHEINPEIAKFCFKCGLPLTQEAVKNVESIKADYMQLSDLDEIREMKDSLKKELEEISKLKEMMLKAGK